MKQREPFSSILFLLVVVTLTGVQAGNSYHGGHHNYHSSSSNSNDNVGAVVAFVIIFVFFLLLLLGAACWWWWPGDSYCYGPGSYYYGPYCSQLGHPNYCDVPSCRTAPGPPTLRPDLSSTHYSYHDPETGVREQYRNVTL